MADFMTERNEAIQAANVALEHLYRSQELLNSAGNWGMFDIFAGGALTSFIKRGKMSDAQAELDAARSALRILAREVRDVEEAGAFQIAGGDFLSFADIFFDNAFLDIYVQTQISEAKRQVAGAIQQVEALRDRLSRM